MLVLGRPRQATRAVRRAAGLRSRRTARKRTFCATRLLEESLVAGHLLEVLAPVDVARLRRPEDALRVLRERAARCSLGALPGGATGGAGAT